LIETVRILKREVLARGFGVLERVVFQRRRSSGETQELTREILDSGDGVTILPYDPARGTIILIRQFRGVAFLKDGSLALVEACAGKLEGADPLTRVVAETEEETGIKLAGPPRRLFEAYMSPGSFAERITFFVAPYAPGDRIGAGGGLIEEGEDIEVFETTVDEALAMVARGEIIDAKTILLLYYAKATGLPPA
jgi:nudix-type nucleoside diphosphatase (YffH/AdpP family)